MSIRPLAFPVLVVGSLAFGPLGALSNALAAETAASPVYDIVEIPDIGPGGATTPHAINEHGMVTGQSKFRQSGARGAFTTFFWTPAKPRSVGMPQQGGMGSMGTGIAADGTIVGTDGLNVFEGIPHGFTWTQAGKTIIPGTESAVGITPDGVIAGTLDGYSVYKGRSGALTDLGRPDGYPLIFADSISSDARYVLAEGATDDSGGLFYSDVLLNDGGAWRVLGKMGSAAAEGTGVNRDGVACGQLWDIVSDSGGSHYIQRGFINRGGVTQVFGDFMKNFDSEAFGINDAGVVVGREMTAGWSTAHAVAVWPSGAIVDLNDRLAPGTTGWQLGQATGINHRGQIVGTGRHDGAAVAFLLTPRQ